MCRHIVYSLMILLGSNFVFSIGGKRENKIETTCTEIMPLGDLILLSDPPLLA